MKIWARNLFTDSPRPRLGPPKLFPQLMPLIKYNVLLIVPTDPWLSIVFAFKFRDSLIEFFFFFRAWVVPSGFRVRRISSIQLSLLRF